MVERILQNQTWWNITEDCILIFDIVNNGKEAIEVLQQKNTACCYDLQCHKGWLPATLKIRRIEGVFNNSYDSACLAGEKEKC